MAEQKPTVKVKVLLPTTIKGENVKKGGEATVTEAQAKIMREHGFIEGEK